jgi:hypothetical protein
MLEHDVSKPGLPHAEPLVRVLASFVGSRDIHPAALRVTVKAGFEFEHFLTRHKQLHNSNWPAA